MSKVERLDINPGENLQGPNFRVGRFMNITSFATVLIFTMILLILFSLGSGLYYLLKEQGKTKNTVRALSVRIILSFVLFLALFGAYAMGWIAPHSL